MARRIQYLGEPVLSTRDVADWCREAVEDLQGPLVDGVIIPAVTQMCETATGAAIRHARYTEDWPAAAPFRGELDVGQVRTVSTVHILRPDGDPEPFTDFELVLEQRVGRLLFPKGQPRHPLRIEYEAGVDLELYPAVKSWLLMQAGTLYQQRESLVTGTIVTQIPLTFIGYMLGEIERPTRF